MPPQRKTQRVQFPKYPGSTEPTVVFDKLYERPLTLLFSILLSNFSDEERITTSFELSEEVAERLVVLLERHFGLSPLQLNNWNLKQGDGCFLSLLRLMVHPTTYQEELAAIHRKILANEFNILKRINDLNTFRDNARLIYYRSARAPFLPKILTRKAERAFHWRAISLVATGTAAEMIKFDRDLGPAVIGEIQQLICRAFHFSSSVTVLVTPHLIDFGAFLEVYKANIQALKNAGELAGWEIRSRSGEDSSLKG